MSPAATHTAMLTGNSPSSIQHQEISVVAYGTQKIPTHREAATSHPTKFDSLRAEVPCRNCIALMSSALHHSMKMGWCAVQDPDTLRGPIWQQVSPELPLHSKSRSTWQHRQMSAWPPCTHAALWLPGQLQPGDELASCAGTASTSLQRCPRPASSTPSWSATQTT